VPAAASTVVRHVAARTAVPATPTPVERIPVRLSVESVLAVSLMALIRRLRLLRLTAGYESRQAGIATAFGARLRHLGLRSAAAVRLRLARIRRLLALLIGLRFARRIGLRLAAIRHVAHWMPGRVVVAAVETVISPLLLVSGVVAEVRIVLPELFLRGRNEPEVVLGVLKVIFRRHRVARGLGVARELYVFLGNVIGGPTDFHVGTVGFVDPRERILAFAVAPAHAFVLTVSHGFWFVFSDLRRPSRRFSPQGRCAK
jgi:hypothetical protein